MENLFDLPAPTDPIERVHQFAKDLAYGVKKGFWKGSVALTFGPNVRLMYTPEYTDKYESLVQKWKPNFVDFSLLESFGYWIKRENQYVLTEKALSLIDFDLPIADLPLKPPNLLSQSEPSEGSIFISYRRQDSADASGRIYDRLAARFGKKFIFKDVDSIPFGVDFRKYLDKMVSECTAMLVVIGHQWLDIKDETGKRRLDNRNDFVRIEIESALKRDILVIPVLVQGTSMPKDEMLPGSLVDLAYRNAVQVRPDPDFHKDMDRLIKSLEPYMPEIG